MLSSNQRKLISQLDKKKYRLEKNLFVAEGKKVVYELINSDWPFKNLFSTEEDFHPDVELLTSSEMKKITKFKTPSQALGVFVLPEPQKILSEPITIGVDGLSDPGNLGTIIRLCDWFGISELICSKNTVDCFNAKVIQASMGSIARVKCHYVTNLGDQPTYTTRASIDTSGNFVPGANNSYNLGTSSLRWANVYTYDLQLSNEGSTNDVDGTWGNYTIQEGESDLFLINNRNGKKYKFNLTEVS